MSGPKPIRKPPARLRQRQRADGSWRIWWEPETPLRELGFEPVDLDPSRLTWSVREAERLNALVDQAKGAPDRAAPAKGARGRTVKALITAYLASPLVDELSPETLKGYRYHFGIIESRWGSSLVVDFDKGILREWYETLYRTRSPHMSLAIMRAFSILFSYAELRSWRADNPCLRLKLAVPKGRTRVADWAEFDALLVAADEERLPSMKLALTVAVFQGQRQADIVAAERAAFADAAWKFRRRKRGNVGGMRLHPEVVPLLEAMLQIAGDRRRLLHYEGTAEHPLDMPYTGDLFRKAWARVRARAARAMAAAAAARETDPHRAADAAWEAWDKLCRLQFRDLRRTFGHLARLGGADPRDVGDALGNQAGYDPELGEVYMPPSFETASRAVAAIRRPGSTTEEGEPDAEAS